MLSVKQQTDTIFFKNDFMFSRNNALKKADKSNTIRQAQLIRSENKKGLNQRRIKGICIILCQTTSNPHLTRSTLYLHNVSITIACIVMVLVSYSDRNKINRFIE